MPNLKEENRAADARALMVIRSEIASMQESLSNFAAIVGAMAERHGLTSHIAPPQCGDEAALKDYFLRKQHPVDLADAEFENLIRAARKDGISLAHVQELADLAAFEIESKGGAR